MTIHSRLLSITALAALGAGGMALAGGPTDPLSRTSWDLVTIGGEAVDEEVSTTLNIGDDGSIGGNGGCNTYGGSISFSGESGIEISEVFSTMMACPDPAMAQERSYFDALGLAAQYRLEDDRLILLDGDGNAVAEFSVQ